MSEGAAGTDPVVGGRYRLGEVIGYGGMAEVHRGIDTRLGRTVAIKLLRASLASDPTFQARFRAEAQSAAALNHPNVISVYDFGDGASSVGPIAGLPYIVMEFVEGRTLRDIVRRDRRLLPERALEIVADILSALGYSHRMGIIHRDIKPANVMLTPRGDVKVMDFGIARAVADTSSSITATSAVIGTAQYLSPEQARGLTADARSDLYSTGCVLYELLTGRPPFTGGSPVALALAHVRQAAVPPDAVDPGVPATASAVTMKALTKDPADRYSSAAEMRADVERALRGEPVRAPAVGAGAGEEARTELFDARSGAPVATGAGPGPIAGGLLGAAGGAAGDPDADPGESAGERTGWSVAPVGRAGPAPSPDGGPGSGGSRSGSAGGGRGTASPIGPGPDETAAAARRRRRTQLGVVLVVVVLVVLAGLAFGFYRLARGSGTPGPTTSPSAPATVSSLPGTPSAASPAPSTTSSTPSPSTSTPDSVTIPTDLAGQQLSQVESELVGLGLTPRALGGVDSIQPANTVVSTNPGPGSTGVQPGTVVHIQYANGTTLVPNVTGQSVAEATASLARSNFTANAVASGTGEGTVTGQSPEGNQTAAQGSSVTIFYGAVVSPEPSTSASTAPTPSPSDPGPSDPIPSDPTPPETNSPEPNRAPSTPGSPTSAGQTPGAPAAATGSRGHPTPDRVRASAHPPRH